MTYTELLGRVLSALSEAKIEYNLTVVDYACRYYYSGLDRKQIYEELKKQIGKMYINDILMVYDCLTDVKKVPFPKYIGLIDAMRSVLV